MTFLGFVIAGLHTPVGVAAVAAVVGGAGYVVHRIFKKSSGPQ